MDTLLRNLRFAARTLAKTPGFTTIAVLALALGIGINTSIFSVVDAVLLRPLPYADPGRLVFLQENAPSLEGMSVSFPNYLDWKAQNQVFEHLAARQPTSYNVTSIGAGVMEPERVEGSNVTANLFPLLGVSPVLGRTFSDAEDRPGAQRVVVLSYGFWQRYFGGNRDVLGKNLTLDDQQYTVIGVMPRDFRYPLTHLKGELWTSLGRFADENTNRGNHPGIYCVARLKPGVSLEMARAGMGTVAYRLEQQYKDSNEGHRAGIYFLHERIVRDIRPAMLVVTGAVWFVLLIACANVANLLLARAAGRAQEIAIRTALGAGRGQLIRQLLTESLMLSLAGGALGFLFTLIGVKALVAILPPNLPRLSTVTVDSHILLFTLILSLLTGLLFGVVPAWQVSRQGIGAVLNEASRRSSGDARRQHTRSALMVAEIALSLALLIGAGLMMRSILRLSQTTPGFNPAGVVTMEIGLPRTKYKDPQQWTMFYNTLLDKVRALPGVRSAGTVLPLPMGGGGWQTGMTYEGRQMQSKVDFILTDIVRVSPDYFSAMGVPLLKGRPFTTMDKDDSAKVAIIDETLANKYFPGENPLGKKVGMPEGPDTSVVWREVVGVAAHVKNYGLDQESRVELYLPMLQSPRPFLTLVVRTAVSDPTQLAGAVRRAVSEIDPNQPVYNVTSMDERVALSLGTKRAALLLLGIFAVAALVLAAVGLYGVISYSVTQRTQEIGIRIALGASVSDVLGMVLGQGVKLVAAGLAAGLIVSFALTRLMSTLLFGVSATDPLTIVVVSLLLAVVAAVASFIPARRATRVDPIVALRYE